MTQVISEKPSIWKNNKGLSTAQVLELQKEFGKNAIQISTTRHFYKTIWDIIREPMFLLLIIACALYFILGQASEGFMMLVAMIIVATISVFQEVKSGNALMALKQLTEPQVMVRRNGTETAISAVELVPNDIMILEEGMKVPADAVILEEHDFTVNESVITGESLPVDKHSTEGLNILYHGTTVNTGKCIAKVTATGLNTTLGKLGKSIIDYDTPKTLLQLQVNSFVRRVALFGLIGFLIIFIANYLQHQQFATSLLFALALAMSAIPEELPVAFSSFMALGAYNMSKLGIITRQPQIIENLGAVSVICVDKTGTITENKMEVKSIYDYDSGSLIELKKGVGIQNRNVLRFAALACEQNPFDAMEKAILASYDLYANGSEHLPTEMIYEYPLEGVPPMMTHVYQYANTNIVAAKGGAERILGICKLNDEDEEIITAVVKIMASKGYRVIAVASALHTQENYPLTQDEFNWKFEGVVALYDPPKENVGAIINQFYEAKIDVKLITGDYPETAMNIAEQVGIRDALKYVTGAQVIKLSEPDLQMLVKSNSIFARMFPDAKLKVINALKANGEIVAMIGDGVNDGPALKAANIGIALGQKGTEIARQASDLILTSDNLDSMITAISQGRKLFSNLKKAFRYIISIHIPIIFIASLPIIFGWIYPNIFSPIHIIFMELIMGPTCSIFFEKEPVENNIMQQKPRKRTGNLFSNSELTVSIVQGLIIAAGAMGLYYYFMNAGISVAATRNIVFTTLILSNVFLTFVNRSFTKSIWSTLRFKNKLAPLLVIVSTLFLLALHLVPFVRNLFQLEQITLTQFLLCLAVSFVSVIWLDIFKAGFLSSTKKVSS